MEFSALFSPIYIGNIMLKNRIVMPPMVVSLAKPNGEVTSRLINYYEARAKGGVGLIIVEAACVDVPTGREAFSQLNIDQPSYIAGLARLADTIKAYSCRAFIQLFHAGRQTSKMQTGGVQPVAPSPIPCRTTREMPKELTIDEIKEIEAKFINAAYYAHLAGFDGVEIHAAHGYLINQFLSANSNIRTDEYGGKLKNRTRILINIIKGIKAIIPGLIISVRLNIDDFVVGGLEPLEAIEIAKSLEKAGVNLINCSTGIYESGLKSIEPSSYPEGWRVYLADKIKNEVSIPVMTGGVIRNPDLANNIIAEENADLVFIGRSLLADPDWPSKARQGKLETIRPCIMCNNCIKSNFSGHSISCTVNTFLGREGDHLPLVSNSNYKVAIIGGGPAGMQAAIFLAQIGCQTSLYEKSSKLGGQLKLAQLPPFKQRIGNLVEYLENEIIKNQVDVHLKHEFTESDISQDFDMVVMATGAKPNDFPFPLKPHDCFSIEEVLAEKVEIKDSVVAVVGGGRNGCEVADFLLKYNNKITIIEKQSFLAVDMEKKNRRDMMNRLATGQVKKLVNCKVIEINHKKIKINSPEGEEIIKTDYIVLATGYESQDDLYIKTLRHHPNVHLIGDAYEVRDIKHAFRQARAIADLAYYQMGRGLSK